MNQERRTEIEKVITTVEGIKDAENSSYDDLNEGLQATSTGAKIMDNVWCLEGVISELQTLL